MTDLELRAALEQIVRDVDELPETLRTPDHQVVVQVTVVRAMLERLA